MADNGDARPPAPMGRLVGNLILGLGSAGFPLTQLAIARLGRAGAVLAVGITGGLFVRDAALIATGMPGRLQRAPAALLWAETAVAAAATGSGLLLLRDPGVAAARQRGWSVSRMELFRRFAVGALFGLRTMRLRIELASSQAPRDPEPPSTPA
jgi:hypothetical protein